MSSIKIDMWFSVVYKCLLIYGDVNMNHGSCDFKIL